MGHEIGHQLTMPDDSEPPACDAIGIMGANGPQNSAYYYSSCSREAFRNHYNEVVERDGVFCLEKKSKAYIKICIKHTTSKPSSRFNSMNQNF